MPNPILKVLSTLQKHQVKSLLMGGQACVYYGAAEFSRDTDVALLASKQNLQRLDRALSDLEASVIAVPPFDVVYLDKGHSVHFRCKHPEAFGMRLDIMSVMRGLPSFEHLWARRTTAEMENQSIELLSLPDLVCAKKTQRDKDWPMIRRLVESHFIAFSGTATRDHVEFWLRECRSPDLLRDVARAYPDVAKAISNERSFLSRLQVMSYEDIELELNREEEAERALDKAYWKPLREELERLRHG